MHKRLFATACDHEYYPGLQALLNSILAYHGTEIPVHVCGRGFDSEQVAWLDAHPTRPYLWPVASLPLPVRGMWEAKQQIFAHCLGRARCVCLLDADVVLTSSVDDVFELAAAGAITSSADGAGISFGPEYAAYAPSIAGRSQAYINTGALCLDVVRHWDLVGLWAFASNYAGYSPGSGFPLALPGHGDQGVFNALAALLGKERFYHVLPEGTWCDSSKGCTLRIRSKSVDGRLDVWNETDSARQRLVHSSGPKWWTEEGVRHLGHFGEKRDCFLHFAAPAAMPALPARIEPH